MKQGVINLYRYLRLRGLAAATLGSIAFAISFKEAYVKVATTEADWVWRLMQGEVAQALALLAAAFAIWTAASRAGSDKIFGDYTLSIALAHGYLHNFLKWIPEELPETAQKRIIIFRANRLGDLSRDSKTGLQNRLEAIGVRFASTDLKALEAGGKSYNALEGAGSGTAIAFDFPMTILTIASLVDYRSQQDDLAVGRKWTEAQREEYARDYIDRFYKTLSEELRALGLADTVVFADAAQLQALNSADALSRLPVLGP